MQLSLKLKFKIEALIRTGAITNNDLHVCAGCGTEATNCKPITNLKEKIELSNLH
jgi:bacterioferritin-associated ferredoxin